MSSLARLSPFAPFAPFALCALCACADNAVLSAPALDSALFSALVQPTLAARCASPACHGSDRRRLRVYAPGFFRSDPARTHRDEPLSPEELSANERSAAAFALQLRDARESLLLQKPLGAAGHLGGRVFTETDSAHDALLQWLRSGGLP